MKKTTFTVLAALMAGCGTAHQEVDIMAQPKTIDPSRYALDMQSKTLDNGLEITAVKLAKLPVFRLEIELLAGSVYDPKGQEGLANLTGSMLEQGAGGLSSDEIAEIIEGMGAQMDVSVGKTTGNLSLKTLSQDADSGLAVLSKVLTEPNFDKQEFSKLRKRTISSIYSSKSNPNTVLRWSFDETVYQNHPLAHPVIGYDSTVSKISLDQVKEFYKAHYFPGNARVVVVSDMEPDQAIKLVEKHLGSWKAESHRIPDVPDVPEIKGKTVKVVRMPDLTQCYINLGMNGIKRNSPEYNSVRVMNYILSGSGFSSRVTKKIRVENGYAYSVWGYFTSGYGLKDKVLSGVYIAGLETKTETGSKAVNMLLQLISDAKAKGFTQEELEAAQKYYTGSIARSGETYNQLSGLILYQKRYGLEDLYWIKDIVNISQLSLDQVNRAAKDHLDPDNFALVIVADTSYTLDGFENVEYTDYKSMK